MANKAISVGRSLPPVVPRGVGTATRRLTVPVLSSNAVTPRRGPLLTSVKVIEEKAAKTNWRVQGGSLKSEKYMVIDNAFQFYV